MKARRKISATATSAIATRGTRRVRSTPTSWPERLKKAPDRPIPRVMGGFLHALSRRLGVSRLGLVGRFALLSALAVVVMGFTLAEILKSQVQERALANAA